MHNVFFSALIASLFLINTVRADCPPVLTNGKLYGILPVTNQSVAYTDIVDCGTVSQADLFRRARLWLTQSFHSSTDTFTLSDKETGDLVGRVTQVVTLPRSESSAGGVYTFRYSFVVECSNRKYRATITQITLEDGARSASVETYCQKNEKDLQVLYSELDKQLKTALASLQENVKNYKAF